MKQVLLRIIKGALYVLGGGAITCTVAAVGSLFFTGCDITTAGAWLAFYVGCGAGFFYGLYSKFD